MSDLDRAKAEAFAGKVLASLNHGALCLMISIGHRTGLFDTMGKLPPARSDEIAARAELNERYVREWLGAMVTAGVVDFDPASNCYSLPPEHAAFLTRTVATEGLGAMWGEERTREYLRKAGFRSLTTHRLAHDIQNNWYVVMK